MKKSVIIVSAILGVMALPVAVVSAMAMSGDRGEYMAKKMFERHDLNKDGKVTRAEMAEKQSNFFDMMDDDKDGVITKEEAAKGPQKFHEKMVAKKMMKFDTDSDGFVSEAEFTGHILKRFKEADKDQDGKLSAEELGDMKGPGKHRKRWKNG